MPASNLPSTATIDEVLERYPPASASVIPLLQQVQGRFGYLALENLARVAEYTRTPLSRVYGVATFYSQFRLRRPGRHVVRACQGTACHVLGAKEILEELSESLEVEEGGTTADGEFTLEVVRCLGCCSLAPALMIDDVTFGRMTRQRVREVLAASRTKDAA